ncbi:hypothetical protein Gorai_022774, partial [Gossypium raimondii]|nr:hypothetical protein [Gossypium raimondii]
KKLLGAVYDWVRRVFNGATIDAGLNNTLIVLVPKVANPEGFAQFRPISLHSVLYKLVMKVLWSGVPLSNFRLAKGIWQGFLLSPYPFVLYIEWLGHLIHLAISDGKWSPIRLSQSRPVISHLLFADELVIFSKTDLKHGKIIKDILEIFCEFFGHKINARKTNIFFSKRVKEPVADLISSLLGFQKVQNFGHYLRVPLFHRRVTNSTMYFVVEKVCGKLQSWDGKQLSIVGRVTLKQSVLLSIPSYFMQSMLIPRKVCDEIERLVKQLPDHVIQHIMGIPPSHPSEGPNKITWCHSSSENFLVKSAYKVLKEDVWKPKDEKWKSVWKIPSLQRNRNLYIFQGSFWSSREIIKVLYYWAKHFFSTFRDESKGCYKSFLEEWNFGNRVLINIDGTVQLDSGNVAAGGVVRDENGDWIFGYNRCQGKCSIFYAELWGILEGLKLIQ